MGLFDIFRSKVKDLGDSLDENELTAEEGSEEASITRVALCELYRFTFESK